MIFGRFKYNNNNNIFMNVWDVNGYVLCDSCIIYIYLDDKKFYALYSQKYIKLFKNYF